MILALDDVIPYGSEAFASAGEVRLFSARSLRREDLKDADALIVRSITRVDAALLDDTRVGFVGTASVGMDNLDEPYLRARGIPYANAAGSNANSVAEYITAALLVAAERGGWELGRKSLGIVGAGNVGSAVERKARALGMRAILCDPPLREATGDARYRLLDEVLETDIVTLHVPLTRSGRHPTWHMFGRGVIARLRPHQLLINSARGPVVDSGPLAEALDAKRIQGAILDVWEGEPRIDYRLLDRVEIGTAHIAGYSLDGKIRCTEMMVEAVARRFGIDIAWDSRGALPPDRRIRVSGSGQPAVAAAVRGAYDIRHDDGLLRATRELPTDEAATGFDRLRNQYALRPEFRHHVVEISGSDEATAATMRALGFQLAREDRALF